MAENLLQLLEEYDREFSEPQVPAVLSPRDLCEWLGKRGVQLLPAGYIVANEQTLVDNAKLSRAGWNLAVEKAADVARLRAALAKCEVQLRGRGPVEDVILEEVRAALEENYGRSGIEDEIQDTKDRNAVVDRILDARTESVCEMREPTSDECSATALLSEGDGVRRYAIWYPQMGGYVGHAVVEISDGAPCVEIYVWHDGQFPFSDDAEFGVSPAHLHHCGAEQFIRFGQQLEKLQHG